MAAILPFVISGLNMLNLAEVLILALVVLAGIAVWRLASLGFQYLGRMVITCPENQKPAGVSVDARHTLATGLGGVPKLRLADCSRWPEKAGCGQPCLSQIADSPADCLVRNLLVRWYEGKSCAWCGLPFGEIHLADRKPAVLRPDQRSVEWNDIPADQLHETLATAQPLCFGCHMANSMVREHPELVIDRSRPPLTGTPRRPHAV